MTYNRLWHDILLVKEIKEFLRPEHSKRSRGKCGLTKLKRSRRMTYNRLWHDILLVKEIKEFLRPKKKKKKKKQRII
jgi:hypothetical protein